MDNNFNSQIENLIKEIEQDSSSITKLTEEDVKNMSEEQLTQIRRLVNPYGRTIQGSDKVHALSILNLKEDYIRKFMMTGLTAFLYRMQSEYNTDPYTSEAFVRRVRYGVSKEDFNEDDINFINNTVVNSIDGNDFLMSKFTNGEPEPNKVSVKSFNEIFNDEGMCIYEETDNQYFERKKFLQRFMDHENETKRSNIKEFLDYLFNFNPDIHVRRAREKLTGNYKANLESMQTSTNINTNVDVNEKSNNETSNNQTKSSFVSIFKSSSNIPLDTFSRFKYYCDTNYEELRQATNMLYSVQPDIDFAINIYDSFTDTSVNGVTTSAQKQCDNFISKHQKEVIADIVSIPGGKWALMGPFKENRNRVSFLNDNTKIIEDIFKQSEVDAKLGAELMKKRVLLKKKANEKREGAIHPNFLRYTKDNVPSVQGLGATVVSDDPTDKTEFDDSEILQQQENPMNLPIVNEEDSIEVPVHSINLKSGTIKTSVFHSQAEAPINKN